jgi:16S rRNA processing protein RimM
VARILGAKGLAGAVRLESLTDRPERLTVGAALFLEGETAPRRVRQAELGGKVPVVALEGIDTRESAEALAGQYLEVDRDDLPAGSFYWDQIVGLRVTDEAGAELGDVVEVFRAGENEVYRVTDAEGGELLLPALRDVIREIDLGAGRMIVRYEAEEVR